MRRALNTLLRRRASAAILIFAAIGASSAAVAEGWIYEPPAEAGGPAAAFAVGVDDFNISLSCAADAAESAQGYLAGGPPPLFIYVATRGFVRDAYVDLDTLGRIEAAFAIDNREPIIVGFEYRASSRDFVAAAPYDGPLVASLQSGRYLAIGGIDVEAFGEVSLTGSRRAIDLLRAYCPDMTPSRPIDGLPTPPGVAFSEDTVQIGPVTIETDVGGRAVKIFIPAPIGAQSIPID